MEKAKFLGWSKTKTSIYKDAAPEEGVLITSITFGENDETVYAVWASDIDGDGEPDYEETKYDLNYDVNGGQNGPANVPDAYINGQTVTLDTDTVPTRDGAVFIGWSESLIEGVLTEKPAEGTVVTEVTFGEADKTVYAVWALDEDGDKEPDYNEDKYTLSYDGNGNTSGTAPAAEEHVEDAAVTLADKGDLERTQAEFLGWSLTRNGLIESQEAEDAAGIITELTMPGADETVYAVWASDIDEDGTPDYEDDKYDLTYDANGGEGGPGTVADAYLNMQTVQLATEPEPTKEGLTFIGWSEELHEDAYSVAPEDGVIISAVTFEDADKTVYAVWAEDSNGNGEPDYDESYNLTITYTYASGEEGSTSALPSAYTQEGLAVGQGYSVPSPAVSGYVARPSVVSGTIYDSDVNVTVIYYRDSNGNGEPDRDESYSLTIYYAFAAGEAGNASLPGTYTASGLTVGYNYSVTSPWVSGYVARPAVVSGTIYDSNVTATVYYYIDSNGNGVPDSEEPAAPDPGTPGNNRPAETGAGDTAEAAAETAETDEYDLTEIDRDDDRERTTIDEDDTPLGNKDLNEADAESESEMCILHWLILLAALIIALFFILDGSRRQKKIDDLKDQLKKGRR